MAPHVVATTDMAVYCFDVISSSLNNQRDPAIPRSIPNEKFPLFVTWKIGSGHRLRGCIGTFSNLNLHEGLRDYALTSAFRDSRFSPIGREELSQLHCGVSLLVQFEPAKNFLDWTVGVHGIRIHYMDGSTRRDAVYLPEVAEEQGWDHHETIDNLIQKGGYRGSINEAFRMAVKVTRFQSSKIVISYDEYASYKRTHSSNQ